MEGGGEGDIFQDQPPSSNIKRTIPHSSLVASKYKPQNSFPIPWKFVTRILWEDLSHDTNMTNGFPSPHVLLNYLHGES